VSARKAHPITPQQAGGLGGLTAWAYNREQKLADAAKGREAFLSRFKNAFEKRLYFQGLALKRGRREAAEALRPTLTLRPDPAGKLSWQYWSGHRWVRVYGGMPPPALRELREHIGLPLGLWLLNRLPQVFTLRGETKQWQVSAAGEGDTTWMAQAVSITQRPLHWRALYFVLVGWWLSLLWLEVAWLVGLTIIGLPLSFFMFSKSAAVTTLRRT